MSGTTGPAGARVAGPLDARAPPPLRLDRRWPRNLLDCALFLAGGVLLVRGVAGGAEAMGYNWQWYRVPQFFGRTVDGEFIRGPFLRGLLITLQITGWAALIAFVLGLATALARLSRSWIGHGIVTVYLELIRNTPLLIQIRHRVHHRDQRSDRRGA